MAKQISLSTGRVYDTDVQMVSERQLIIGHVAYMSQKIYVVSKITHSSCGCSYELIDIETEEFRETSSMNLHYSLKKLQQIKMRKRQ